MWISNQTYVMESHHIVLQPGKTCHMDTFSTVYRVAQKSGSVGNELKRKKLFQRMTSIRIHKETFSVYHVIVAYLAHTRASQSPRLSI